MPEDAARRSTCNERYGRARQDIIEFIGQVAQPPIVNRKAGAPYIGMSRSFLRQSRMNGRRQNRTSGPPFLKIGRKVLYLADDLDAWLLEHRHEG